MFELGAGHARFLVTGIRLGNRICPDFSREFGSKEFFDDLHFINSPNAPP
jgi:hypothetical protein